MVKNDEMKMMVGSAVIANTKPLPAPNDFSSTPGFASGPNTNRAPWLLNSRNCLTPLPTALKKA
jgi:hypothetical protein